MSKRLARILLGARMASSRIQHFDQTAHLELLSFCSMIEDVADSASPLWPRASCLGGELIWTQPDLERSLWRGSIWDHPARVQSSAGLTLESISFYFCLCRLYASMLPYADAHIHEQKTHIMDGNIVMIPLHACLRHAGRQALLQEQLHSAFQAIVHYLASPLSLRY